MIRKEVAFHRLFPSEYFRQCVRIALPILRENPGLVTADDEKIAEAARQFGRVFASLEEGTDEDERNVEEAVEDVEEADGTEETDTGDDMDETVEKRPEKHCAVCGAAFVPCQKSQLYCSEACRKAFTGRASSLSIRKCHDCGKPTTDYRCERCRTLFRNRHGVPCSALDASEAYGGQIL